VTPTDLLAQRHRDYAKALDQHLRALEQWRIAQERVQALERELAEAAKIVAASRREKARGWLGSTAPRFRTTRWGQSGVLLPGVRGPRELRSPLPKSYA
jgi:hypothetical protein